MTGIALLMAAVIIACMCIAVCLLIIEEKDRP